MGGHGGLNILPQKSWNVYNYENREKVRLDEEKQAQEQQEVRDKALKNDREFRHRLLLERASKRLKAGTEDAPLLADVQPAAIEADSGSDSPPEVSALTGTRVGFAPPSGAHVNLFEDFEQLEKSAENGPIRGGRELQVSRLVAPRPPTLKEAQEASKRGKGGDESHRLGHGCVVDDKGKRPWYTSAPSRSVASNPSETRQQGSIEGYKGDGAVPALPCAAVPALPSTSSMKKSILELRAERLQRERAERGRALQVQGMDARKLSQR